MIYQGVLDIGLLNLVQTVLMCIKKSDKYCLNVSLFVNFSFFLTSFHHMNSASMGDRVFKLSIHDKDDQVYY